jgi:DinB superfamily
MGMDFRTDRTGVLLDLLATSADMARERLASLTDDEYLWSPVAPCWTVRRRGDPAAAPDAFGPGDWLLDHADDVGDPPPFTTVAWRLGHLANGFASRSEWSFGEHVVDPTDLVAFAPTASEGLGVLWSEVERFAAGVAETGQADLDMVGYSQMPYGLDPQVPFCSIVWWQTRELIHHTAEAALLRDLYAAQADGRAG